MTDNADRGKKSLIVMVATFLLMGGGVFVFLIWNGLQDMQDVKFRSFGSGITGRAALPILKYFGFVDKETPEGKARDEKALKIEEALNSGGSAAGPSGQAAAPASAAAPSRQGYSGGGSGSASRLGASLSGAGALGGGGSKSFSSFSGSGDSGGLRLAGGSGAGSSAAGAGKTMNALMASRGHLAAATNTGSALAAKSRWDQGFGMKHAGAGGGGQMSSYNQAAASLDHVETGEVGSLKFGDPGTLAVPDVGKPKAVKEGETAADKAKDALKKNMADQIAQALLGGPAGGGGDAGKPSKPLPADAEEYINNKLIRPYQNEFHIDKEYDYTAKKCSAGCPDGVRPGQDYYHITFRGNHNDPAMKNNCAVYQLEGGKYESSCF